MKKYILSICISFLTLSTFVHAEDMCSASDSSWFVNSFEELGLKSEAIEQCL